MGKHPSNPENEALQARTVSHINKVIPPGWLEPRVVVQGLYQWLVPFRTSGEKKDRCYLNALHEWDDDSPEQIRRDMSKHYLTLLGFWD